MGNSSHEVRRRFLDFFRERQHEEVPSSPLVPANDPTLLFTNAGMVQFKDVFTGRETRGYSRATSAQKCLRAGGKHNDLENVGYTPRHHTFFEMLGNFSFGDYFKEGAIRYAWDFVTDVLGLDPERLAVTVFEGEGNIAADEEAERLWLDVGVRADRVYRMPRSENYWQMGETGPQGPCSEIHYHVADPTPDMWNPELIMKSVGWLEIWNLVFMQFQREKAGGPLTPLPRPSVDTGMGLERTAMVLQGRSTTYDIDEFAPLLDGIAAAAGRPYRHSDGEDDVSMRVIADHARATAFLVADGVQPSNEGRGYVLRRIMRRAIRHGRRLGFEDPFLHEACGWVVKGMSSAYPELERAAALIEKVAENEEIGFRRTLDRGLRVLAERMEGHESGDALEPALVADLYDTFGFPIDLTRVIAEEKGLVVDEEAAMEAVRTKQAQGAGGDLNRDQAIAKAWFGLRDSHGATAFEGYESLQSKGRVVAILQEGSQVQALTAGEEGDVLVDRTPFYGESGGQIGDAGQLSSEGVQAAVLDAYRPLPELIVHRTRVTTGRLAVGDRVELRVTDERRAGIRRNHSATHLLHLALREVLGDHVQQKGSLVAPDRLRFDFSHFEPLTTEHREAIEARVSEMILANTATEVAIESLESARAAGAMMLFGEKYADEVRMVRIGGDSLELCGGTHVERSGDIGSIVIVTESAVASGVRRIEAITGPEALRHAQARERLVQEISRVLKVQPSDATERLERLVRRSKELERALEEAKAALALRGSGPADEPPIEEIDGLRVLFKQADGTPKKALRTLADQLRDRLKSGVVVVTAKDGDTAALLVAATRDLGDRVHAGRIVQESTKPLGGSGGGRPDFAQGGVPTARLDEGLDRIRRALLAAP